MIRNYLLTSWRNIVRHTSVSFMNIIGLSIGLACSLLIFLWVVHELSYDRFHAHADRIYRVEEDQHYSNGIFHVTVTPWPSGPVWKEKIPEIEQACRITSAGSFLITHKEESFYEDKVSAVDSSFFNMFSFQLLEGDPALALKEPGSIVMSSDMAAKYFGSEDPVGKTLMVNTREIFKITGVMKNMPVNSSIDVDFLIPFDYMKKSEWYSESWDNNSIMTYVMLRNNISDTAVNQKLTQIVREHIPENNTDFILAPLTRMHLYSYFGYGHKPGAILNIWIFSSIALLVLIIACINFMNLSTARSASRAKEIGLRKANGAHRNNLVLQFFSESILTALISTAVAVIIVMLSLRPFNLISGKEFQVTDLVTPVFIGGMLLITLFTGIVAGIYPSFVLSGFKPMNTLKGTSGTGNKGGMFRKITVTIQYALSILLIAGTIIIYRQLDFMQSQKLGYDKENLLYIPLRGDLKNSYPVIKEELLRNPVVKSITASTHPPQNIGSNSSGASWEGKPTDMDVLISMSGVDFDYVETMGIEMKSGRTFSRSYAEDSPRDSLGSFLINEQMEKLMGMQNVIGARLQFGHTGPVIGVMRDFNFHSLHNKIEPLAISIWGGNFLNFMYIRINPGNLPAAMKQLENAWNRILPLFPFDYHFVSDDFDKTYRTEERMGTLMNYFAVMAILIACIGLFGLAAFTVEQKTREVGIRKALGATSLNIFVLFAKEFMQLLVIAIGISLPAAWFLFSRFLQNYSYHTQLDGWIFIISALTAMAVALTAISYQIFRAIRTNPAETLKFE